MNINIKTIKIRILTTISLFLLFIFFPLSIILAAKILPEGVTPTPIQGVAKMPLTKFHGALVSSSLIFWNTGGLFDDEYKKATLETYCDDSTLTNGQTCTGTVLQGIFSGGPDGVATFQNEDKTFSLKLENGQYFTSTDLPGWKVTVKNPEIFNEWTEGGIRFIDISFTDISGQPTISCNSKTSEINIYTKVFDDCKIKTDKKSSLTLNFHNSDSITIKPNTELVINFLDTRSGKISLDTGSIWIKSKNLEVMVSLAIDTNEISADVKNSHALITKTDDTTKVEVTSNTVSLQNKFDKSGETLNSGEAIVVSDKGSVEKSKIDASILDPEVTQKPTPTEPSKLSVQTPSKISFTEQISSFTMRHKKILSYTLIAIISIGIAIKIGIKKKYPRQI